jgi:hypothetical protein
MEEQIQEYLYNPTVGKIGFYWHRSNLMLKAILKESFRKLKTITIAIRLRNSVLSWLFLTIIL